jgi:hypothetical protein
MSEAEPQDTRPLQTESGQLIVYMVMGDAGIYIDCPALGYGMGIPRTAYSEESVKHSLETIIRSNSRAMLFRAEKGEQFPEKRLDYARRYADEDTALPLVFVKQFQPPIQNGF